MGKLLSARPAALNPPLENRMRPPFAHAQPWPTLALESAWWSRLRDREPVRTALAIVLHGVWEARLQRAFEDNERLGRGLRNVKQLAEFIERDASGTNRRVRSATGDVTLTDLFLFAWALRVPVRDLLPTQVNWIAGAVRHLLPEVTEREGQAYALYRWHSTPSAGEELDASALTRVVKELDPMSEEDARTAVLRVAGGLEIVLTPFAHWLRESR